MEVFEFFDHHLLWENHAMSSQYNYMATLKMLCLLIVIVIKCLCVFQASTLMAVGLGVAAAGFAGEHNRFDARVHALIWRFLCH